MKNKIKAVLSILITAIIILSSFSAFASASSQSDFVFLEYPDEAITEFDESFLSRVSGNADYIVNKGYSDTSLYISPYWKMKIGNKEAPVYATLNYDETEIGVLQSFQYVFPQNDNFSFDVNLTFIDKVTEAICLPEKENIKANISENGISATLDNYGAFTFLINGDSQKYAVTIFVREYKDEEKEIADYKNQYGEENVKVYEKGYYAVDELSLDSKVIYFCRGSFIKANHIADINSSSDEGKVSDFMFMNGKNGNIVTGCGTIDFNSLDWHERNHAIIRYCKNTTIDGLIFLNPSSWTLSVYGSENIKIGNVAVFGYRTNSDGINICSSNNVAVSDCFIRTGDDCFSVKSTDSNFEAYNIKFTDCVGWSNKARCFGITGEVYNNIHDIEFSDCAIIYRNSTWDNNKVSSLAVINEMGGKNIDNVLFRNIEIYHETGRPIIVMAAEDDIVSCQMTNIRFENISVKYAGEKSRLSSQRDITNFGKFAAKAIAFIDNFNAKLNELILKISPDSTCKPNLFSRISTYLATKYNSGNSIEISMDNITVNGDEITPSSKAFKNQFIVEGNTVVK